MLGLALLDTSQMHACPFPKAPTCFKIAGALFQMPEVHIQYLPVGTPFLAKFFPSGLWPLTLSTIPFPKKSKSHQSFGCANLGTLSTFFLWCLASKTWDSSWPQFSLSWAKAFSPPFPKRFFSMVLLLFLACIFLGLCFLYLFQSRCRPFQCIFQSRCWPFQWSFPIAQGSLQTILFQNTICPAFFWQCTLRQRKCLFFCGVPAWLSSNTSGKPLPAMETSRFSFFSFLFESSAALPFSKGSATGLGACSKASGISSSFKPCCSSEKSSLQSLAAAAVSPFLPSFLTWKRMQEVLSILRLAHTWPELEVSFSSGLSAIRLISALTGWGWTSAEGSSISTDFQSPMVWINPFGQEQLALETCS